MGFRFRKSVKLFPGVRINFSNRGVSSTIGKRGASINVSKRGVRGTVGIPGSGLSYSEMIVRNGKKPRNSRNTQSANPQLTNPLPVSPSTSGNKGFPWGWVVLGIFLFIVFL